MIAAFRRALAHHRANRATRAELLHHLDARLPNVTNELGVLPPKEKSC